VCLCLSGWIKSLPSTHLPLILPVADLAFPRFYGNRARSIQRQESREGGPEDPITRVSVPGSAFPTFYLCEIMAGQIYLKPENSPSGFVDS
jgi:hypothetical protein